MTHKYDPDYAVHPGETVKEYILTCDSIDNVFDVVHLLSHPAWVGPKPDAEALYATRGLPEGRTEPDMLVELMGVIFCGEPLLSHHAEILHKILGVPAKFWLDRQAKYDERVKANEVKQEKPGSEQFRADVREKGARAFAEEVEKEAAQPSTGPIKVTVELIEKLMRDGWELNYHAHTGLFYWGNLTGGYVFYEATNLESFPQQMIDYIRIRKTFPTDNA